MTDETLQTRLARLEAEIATLPEGRQAALRALLRETKQRQSDVKKDVASARDALADWRIAMKYRVFDLEARRREARR